MSVVNSDMEEIVDASIDEEVDDQGGASNVSNSRQDDTEFDGDAADPTDAAEHYQSNVTAQQRGVVSTPVIQEVCQDCWLGVHCAYCTCLSHAALVTVQIVHVSDDILVYAL